MSTITLKHVKGGEIVARLADELRLERDRTYRVVVQVEDVELAAAESLDQVMDIIGKRAEKRGLTQQALDEILSDG